jgi:hypothetical protein
MEKYNKLKIKKYRLRGGGVLKKLTEESAF